MDDEKIDNEELNESSAQEEKKGSVAVVKKMGELAGVVANLGVVCAADMVMSAKEATTSFIDSCENEHRDAETRKSEKKANNERYSMQIDAAMSAYKETRGQQIIHRQEAEQSLNDYRCELIDKLADKKAIEGMPVFISYKKAEASQKRLISEAVKRGDTEAIEKCTKELKRLQEDFGSSPVGQQYAKTETDIGDLKKSIQDTREFVKSGRKSAKETRQFLKMKKKEFAEQRSTALANVRKPNKIKALIGKISAMFKGKKSEKEPQKESFLKAKMESLKVSMGNFIQKMQDIQRESLQKAASITRSGKDKVANLGSKVKGGIVGFIRTTRDAKEKRLAAMNKKLDEAIEHVNEKSKKIENKRAPEAPETPDAADDADAR